MKEMGLGLKEALSVIRISFGHANHPTEIDSGILRLSDAIESIRTEQRTA